MTYKTNNEQINVALFNSPKASGERNLNSENFDVDLFLDRTEMHVQA
jgi:hypothetical protein